MSPVIRALATIAGVALALFAAIVLFVWLLGEVSLREAVRMTAFVFFVAACAGLVGSAIDGSYDGEE